MSVWVNTTQQYVNKNPVQPRKVTWNLPLRKEKHLLQTINFWVPMCKFSAVYNGIPHQHHQKHLQILQGNSCCRPFFKKTFPTQNPPNIGRLWGKKNKKQCPNEVVPFFFQRAMSYLNCLSVDAWVSDPPKRTTKTSRRRGVFRR